MFSLFSYVIVSFIDEPILLPRLPVKLIQPFHLDQETQMEKMHARDVKKANKHHRNLHSDANGPTSESYNGYVGVHGCNDNPTWVDPQFGYSCESWKSYSTTSGRPVCSWVPKIQHNCPKLCEDENKDLYPRKIVNDPNYKDPLFGYNCTTIGNLMQTYSSNTSNCNTILPHFGYNYDDTHSIKNACPETCSNAPSDCTTLFSKIKKGRYSTYWDLSRKYWNEKVGAKGDRRNIYALLNFKDEPYQNETKVDELVRDSADQIKTFMDTWSNGQLTIHDTFVTCDLNFSKTSLHNLDDELVAGTSTEEEDRSIRFPKRLIQTVVQLCLQEKLPSDVELDYNGDGGVDTVVILFSAETDLDGDGILTDRELNAQLQPTRAWALWPHKWNMEVLKEDDTNGKLITTVQQIYDVLERGGVIFSDAPLSVHGKQFWDYHISWIGSNYGHPELGYEPYLNRLNPKWDAVNIHEYGHNLLLPDNYKLNQWNLCPGIPQPTENMVPFGFTISDMMSYLNNKWDDRYQAGFTVVGMYDVGWLQCAEIKTGTNTIAELLTSSSNTPRCLKYRVPSSNPDQRDQIDIFAEYRNNSHEYVQGMHFYVTGTERRTINKIQLGGCKDNGLPLQHEIGVSKPGVKNIQFSPLFRFDSVSYYTSTKMNDWNDKFLNVEFTDIRTGDGRATFTFKPFYEKVTRKTFKRAYRQAHCCDNPESCEISILNKTIDHKAYKRMYCDMECTESTCEIDTIFEDLDPTRRPPELPRVNIQKIAQETGSTYVGGAVNGYGQFRAAFYTPLQANKNGSVVVYPYRDECGEACVNEPYTSGQLSVTYYRDDKWTTVRGLNAIAPFPESQRGNGYSQRARYPNSVVMPDDTIVVMWNEYHQYDETNQYDSDIMMAVLSPDDTEFKFVDIRNVSPRSNWIALPTSVTVNNEPHIAFLYSDWDLDSWYFAVVTLNGTIREVNQVPLESSIYNLWSIHSYGDGVVIHGHNYQRKIKEWIYVSISSDYRLNFEIFDVYNNLGFLTGGFSSTSVTEEGLKTISKSLYQSDKKGYTYLCSINNNLTDTVSSLEPVVITTLDGEFAEPWLPLNKNNVLITPDSIKYASISGNYFAFTSMVGGKIVLTVAQLDGCSIVQSIDITLPKNDIDCFISNSVGSTNDLIVNSFQIIESGKGAYLFFDVPNFCAGASTKMEDFGFSQFLKYIEFP
jgi:hypothetical protein